MECFRQEATLAYGFAFALPGERLRMNASGSNGPAG
jgi:hypothetical protein